MRERQAPRATDGNCSFYVVLIEGVRWLPLRYLTIILTHTHLNITFLLFFESPVTILLFDPIICVLTQSFI